MTRSEARFRLPAKVHARKFLAPGNVNRCAVADDDASLPLVRSKELPQIVPGFFDHNRVARGIGCRESSPDQFLETCELEVLKFLPASFAKSRTFQQVMAGFLTH